MEEKTNKSARDLLGKVISGTGKLKRNLARCRQM